jgi:hypothetical protein
MYSPNNPDFVLLNRDGIIGSNPTFEKIVVLPTLEQRDPGIIAWADAKFAIEIMAEHALFFTLLMPPETATMERQEAQQFHSTFSSTLMQIIDNPPPSAAEAPGFAANLLTLIAPFKDYKQRMEYKQTTGKLRSLVWPLFFNHTYREADRWGRRLEQLTRNDIEYSKSEVISFWAPIMDEHAQFMAHLLDPCEKELITKAFATSDTFCAITPVSETAGILAAAEDILDFKTKAVRGIEAGKIKSIIDPQLADHVRREAIKFIDELKRAV